MSQTQERGSAEAVTEIRAGQDALALLTEDHKKAMDLFDRFERIKHTGPDEQRALAAGRVCEALLTHMALEEEIFYPQIRLALDDDEMMAEAEIEHQSAKDLIHDIGAMEGFDDRLSPAMKVLREYVEHHVKEEETEMFPKVQRSGVDLMSLGDRLREAMVDMAANQAGSDSFYNAAL